ncbi:siderophore-interacting protein [Telmatospirillum siberiense]|uniref:Siderophore-interacting protein n=1 Tax=Telmatospirillum siberiense TaxID=382514 RepID=A0A2N3PRD2_9PROT|nr:siderophore-interacting protein [Telmatospirillum siberiense]PKU22967.1 siderophore-interacting protein [Telmatospirillum siberiense]
MVARKNQHSPIPVEVTKIQTLSPLIRRITVAAGSLRSMVGGVPAQWMKVFFPAPSGQRRVGRAISIRHLDSTNGRMDLDFVLHGDSGPASRWANHARPGKILMLAGPRGGYAIDPKVPRYLLIGDATALPAIASIAEALPATAEADVVAEVADSLEEQPLASAATLRVHWLHSGTEAPGTTGRIELAVQALSFEPGDCRIWLAGESFMVRAVLTHLLVDRRISPGAICAKGYWKLGTAGHRREISSAEG